MVNEENQRISNRNNMLDKLCNIVFAGNDQEILAQPLENVIRQHKAELGVTDQQLKSLYAKDSMVSALSEIFRTSKTKQEAIERARDAFQYTLSPLEQNERDLKLIELRAMRNVVEERNL
jgi:predicted RNase H-like HicB family nuclease